jgi:tetratricopeptide (TPR) repeat protein
MLPAIASSIAAPTAPDGAIPARPAARLAVPAAMALLLLVAPALPARQEVRGGAAGAVPAAGAAGAAGASDEKNADGGAGAQGDAAWSRRADGRPGGAAGAGRAAAGPIGEAIAAYERALRQQPDRLEVYWKLLRAEHYRGQFVASTREEKQAVFGAARAVAEAGLDRLGRKVGGRARLDALTPAGAAKALAGVPEAAPLYLWAGVDWALWGDNFGHLAAARQGAGDRIRRYAEVVIAIDEHFEDAGGHRLLGRLHALAPKVPFVTGWIDRAKAVSELRRALALAPEEPLNAVFLADALLQYDTGKSAEARQLLRRVLERPPVPARLVEDEDTQRQAKQLLAGPPG